MERVDVAIVGGGPAGSSAAWKAAEGDANALVIEKGVPREDRDGPGPDSTDAAGLLDYWIDLMEFAPEAIPDEVILRQLDGADFIGPTKSFSIDDTGIDAAHDSFGVAFHRAKFDDWLREEAEAAGATYRVGTNVTDVSTSLEQEQTHTLTLADGEEIEADYLILADGPQRTVTTQTLDQFTTAERRIADIMDPTEVNHIAYQEHRRVPDDVYEPNRLKFWWGLMPGHTAYPWVFPNDGDVARVGLTMPIGLDIGDYDVDQWPLLQRDDERIPQGTVYLERLLAREYPEYELADFPLVEDRGKRKGTETYSISSTRPIESPTEAGIAVVGGAMGGTSAFHEGGDHIAVRTGKLAGSLAASDDLQRYNDAWKTALGEEIRRNVTMAEMVRGYEPATWDKTFSTADKLFNRGEYTLGTMLKAGIPGIKMVLSYNLTKRQFSGGDFVKFREDEYVV